MLILVAVTVTITDKGGLFDTARRAKTETAARAEEEELLTYIYADGIYDATTGDVDIDTLKTKLESAGKTVKENNGKLVVTGAQSGKNYIIDSKGNISEQKEEEEQTSTGVTGKYISFFFEGDEGMEYIEFKENGEFEMKVANWDSTTSQSVSTTTTGKYEYDPTTKIIVIDSSVPSIGGEQICMTEISYEEGGTEKTNKVLHLKEGGLIGATAGFAGFDKYTFTSGTYQNSEKANTTLELTTKTDENGNNYGYLVAYVTDKTPYICLDGYIYCGWEPYEIVSETEIGHLDDDGNVDYVFTKVN